VSFVSNRATTAEPSEYDLETPNMLEEPMKDPDDSDDSGPEEEYNDGYDDDAVINLINLSLTFIVWNKLSRGRLGCHRSGETFPRKVRQ
jgi:hypothetical protein